MPWGLYGDSGRTPSLGPSLRSVPNADRATSPSGTGPPPHRHCLSCGAHGSGVAAKTTSAGSGGLYASTRLDVSLLGRWLPSRATRELGGAAGSFGGTSWEVWPVLGVP